MCTPDEEEMFELDAVKKGPTINGALIDSEMSSLQFRIGG